METINVYAIPLSNTNTLIWVKTKCGEHIIFKAMRVDNVQRDKPQSNKELNK